MAALVLWLLCIGHGADHDELSGSLCAGAAVLAVGLALAIEPRPSRRFRAAPAFAFHTIRPRPPHLPPKIRPA